MMGSESTLLRSLLSTLLSPMLCSVGDRISPDPDGMRTSVRPSSSLS